MANREIPEWLVGQQPTDTGMGGTTDGSKQKRYGTRYGTRYERNTHGGSTMAIDWLIGFIRLMANREIPVENNRNKEPEEGSSTDTNYSNLDTDTNDTNSTSNWHTGHRSSIVQFKTDLCSMKDRRSVQSTWSIYTFNPWERVARMVRSTQTKWFMAWHGEQGKKLQVLVESIMHPCLISSGRNSWIHRAVPILRRSHTKLSGLKQVGSQ